MTKASSTITPVAKTTFKVGTYNAVTDVFTSVVDLNDRASYWLVSVDMPQPKKVYSRSSTIRAPGETIADWNYQNRHIKVTLNLLYGANATALLSAVQTLLAAIENPPYRLAFAAPNTSILTYADVVAVSHTIPYDGKLILNNAVKKIVIDFECLPGLPGDRLMLQNLVMNPGFEAPSGPGVQVFTDPFAAVSAYAVVGGAAPTVVANVMTIPSGTTLQFGSPAWGAINQWRMRLLTPSAGGWDFQAGIHVTNANNKLWVNFFNGQLSLNHTIGGVANSLGTGSTGTLSNSTWYWLVVTQFPALPGTAPAVQATLYNDSAGALGTRIVTVGPVLTFDAVTALTGAPQLWANTGAWGIGGAFSNAHTVSLFGPGAWIPSDFTAVSAYAWEQSTTNTYGGGPVTSFGAARVDAPPAGAWNAIWRSYNGGAPAGNLSAIPASTGQVMAASAWVRSSGLGASAQIALVVAEYDTNGTFLRQTTLATVTGNQASWTQLAGTVTLGASTVYVSVALNPLDSTAGSANGTVWFDNVQCYNQTTTGQTSMPYCELRFPQSPAQLLVSGLVGEMPTGASVSMGFYVGATLPTSSVWRLASRATPGPGAQLVFASVPNAGAVSPGVQIQSLDSASFGGFKNVGVFANIGAVGMYAMSAGATESDLAGAYHLFGRFLPGDTHYSNQSASLSIAELLSNVYSQNTIGILNGAYQPVGATAAQWTWVDTGVFALPLAPQLSDENLALKWLYFNIVTQITGTVNGQWTWDSLALLPADGDVLAAALGVLAANTWLWYYNTPDSPYQPSVGWRFSTESVALPSRGHAAGSLTNSSVGSVAPLGASYLRLDPTQKTGADGSALAQMVSLFADLTHGNNFGCQYEISYVPQYLFPRAS